MDEFMLGNSTHLVTIAIRVRDRDKMIEFYRNILGFDLKREENELAIFGLKNKETELLWLEESPRAKEHFGEIKKMQRISLRIPSPEEMADLLARLTAAGYPIEESLDDEGQSSFLVNDPEGNQLELYYGENQAGAPEELDKAALLAKTTGEFPVLSTEVRFDKVYLNVSDLAKEQHFLQNVMGLKVRNAASGIHVLNEGDFHIGLCEGSGGTIDLPSHEVLGLDFLQFTITQADFFTLVEHLKKVEQPYFIDKRQKLLTTYDAIGIEWWFFVSEK